MDFTVKGEIRFRSERGSYRLDVKDDHGNEYGVTLTSPQLGGPLRQLEASARTAMPRVETPAPEPLKIPEAEKGFVRRCYDLTTEFHVKTGVKAQIADILEAFFVDGIKNVDPDDYESFERRLAARLQEQVPGWDK